MYIPEIILLVIIMCLGFYLYHKDNVHRTEMNKIKDGYENKIRELNRTHYAKEDELKKFHLKQLVDLKSGKALMKTEDEFETLKDELYVQIDKLEKRLLESENEPKENYDIWAKNLLLISNILKSLGQQFDLENSLNVQASFTHSLVDLCLDEEYYTEQINFLIKEELI
ncbi:MAG: hypothetical protein RR338_03065 [Clostridia bacterium]